jgi:hypothetical protein
LEPNPGNITLILIVWAACAFAGVRLIRQAFKEKPPANTRLGMAFHGVKFRIRLAAGLALILWVLSGLVWVYINWL